MRRIDERDTEIIRVRSKGDGLCKTDAEGSHFHDDLVEITVDPQTAAQLLFALDRSMRVSRSTARARLRDLIAEVIHGGV